MLYAEVSKSSIESEEEGAVLYMVENPQSSERKRTLTLTKLKTLEYRLFRKMREKLKTCANKGKNTEKNKVMNKFEKESR